MVKCSNCGNEVEETADFCPDCGTKIANSPQIEKKFCEKCGTENSKDADFCSSCGYNFGNPANNSSENPRTLELVLGILGAVFGFLGGLFAIMFSAFGEDLLILGISAFLASIVGLVGAIYLKPNVKYGGIILIIAAIWVLISISAFGLIPCIFFGIAGILALFKK